MTTTPAGTPGHELPQTSLIRELAKALTMIFERPEAAARCRRGLGKPPMQVPEMWEYCMPVVMTVGEDYAWQRRNVEDATHHVLTLYAVHQQSQPVRMHQPGVRRGEATVGERRSVGTASRHLYAKRDNEGTRRRFLAAATAGSVPELAGHLRHLVTLLREESIPLDYITLFRDIADWPEPQKRAQARRRWGLDFHRAATGPTTSSNPGSDAKEQNP